MIDVAAAAVVAAAVVVAIAVAVAAVVVHCNVGRAGEHARVRQIVAYH